MSMSAKTLIVVFRLQHNMWFDLTFDDLLSELAQKDVICKVASTPAQARRHVVSNIRPRAVILADDVVTKPQCHELHARLAEYAAAGGTVIYVGPISTSSLFPDPETMFDDVWGLPWRVTNRSDRYQGSYTVNPLLKGFDTPALVKRCSLPGKPIDKVALGDAVYLPLRFAKKLANANAHAPPPSARTCETHAAFAKVGRGRVGYIGDAPGGLRERATTDLILAMCFWPGSQAPVAPGEIPVPAPALPARPSGPRPRDAEVAARAAARKTAREDRRKRADKLKDKVRAPARYTSHDGGPAQLISISGVGGLRIGQ